MSSNQRTVLITGCSNGSLGYYLAIAFQQAGWQVFGTARNLGKTQDLSKAGVTVVQLDTISDESIFAAVATISAVTGGSLDMLVNNAGLGYTMPLLDVTWEQAIKLFEINFYSLIKMTKAFLPLLRQSTTMHGGVRGGIVVNNTSGASLWPGAMPFGGMYNASKGAATQLTETLRLELAPFGIKVVNLLTGGVKSRFYDNAAVDSLPADSIFNIAKETVEQKMTGKEIMEQNSEPTAWARQTVALLSKSNPPHWVFGGKNSNVVRWATHLPIGFADMMVKKLTGLDIVERIIKDSEKNQRG